MTKVPVIILTKDGFPMFSGFSEKTGSFLWELAFHNERPWFLEHKQAFEDEVNTPFKALAAESFRLFSERVPDFEGWVHVSRIYRDARRLFGRGPYKDHLWFTVKSASLRHGGPDFWFLLEKAAYSYGLGFFAESPAQMEAFRRAVDANPARFLRLAKAVERRGYTLDGPSYKRPKKLFDDPLIESWYNRKWLSVEKSFDLGGDAFTDALPRIVADAWAELKPMHDFLLEAYLAENA